MSKLYQYGAAVSFACLSTYSSNNNSGVKIYFRVSFSCILLYGFASLIYRKFIYPFYTTPLLHLPLIPRKSWKECLSLMTPPVYLDAIDNIPNNGLLRRIDILNEPAVVITSPALIAEFLHQKVGDYERTPITKKILVDELGMGLLCAEDADHKIQRKALAPAFAPTVVKRLAPLFWQKASEMVFLIKDEIAAKSSITSPWVTVDMEDWAARVTIDIIGEAGFGSRFDALTHPFTPLNKGYRSAFITDSSSRSLLMLSFLTSPTLTNWLPLKRVREKTEGHRVVRSWIRETIEERKKSLYHNVDDSDYLEKSGHTDVISAVMQEGVLNTDGLVEQAMTFLGAGHETSATALTWALHELSQPQNIHYQTSLRHEIRTRLPSPFSPSTSPPSSTLLDSLPLLSAISRETLRLHAPVISLARRTKRDTFLGDVLIPKHTHIRVSPWAMGQCKEIWGGDGRKFRPERWTDGSTNEVGGLMEGLVFSSGVKGCIGKGFAQSEHKALLAALVGAFEFRQVGNKHVEPVNVWGITGKILGLELEVKIVESW